jgi:hypothetical protein
MQEQDVQRGIIWQEEAQERETPPARHEILANYLWPLSLQPCRNNRHEVATKP